MLARARIGRRLLCQRYIDKARPLLISYTGVLDGGLCANTTTAAHFNVGTNDILSLPLQCPRSQEASIACTVSPRYEGRHATRQQDLVSLSRSCGLSRVHSRGKIMDKADS